ncbi:MerR family DNA-binding protein [Acinetobacter bouvetii]|uniref:HTH-type transcriptional regulator ZntR n=1 Tax=Acinetobacter bouvetii TaxID=202951 RepID=A0A811G937_9GAMM|nr:MerR family DNA-binding protein [Acinetobacter bouvetii]CAB1214024.1 HTH-type transcriptional regulator ZntR [Acinetobacter bouvetii]
MKIVKNYLIKDIAHKTQLSTDTIRFYEKKQLIQPSFRADNNYRYYDDETLKRLVFIKRCRALDMSLKDIETLIQLEQQPHQGCQRVNELIDEHLMQLEQKIAELQKFQLQLQQLRQSCSSQTTIGDCQILKQLEAAE